MMELESEFVGCKYEMEMMKKYKNNKMKLYREKIKLK